MSQELISETFKVALIDGAEKLEKELTPLMSAIRKHLEDSAPVVRLEPREHPAEVARGNRFWSTLGKKIASPGVRIPDGYDRRNR